MTDLSYGLPEIVAVAMAVRIVLGVALVRFGPRSSSAPERPRDGGDGAR